MTLREQFRELLRELRLILEGRSETMTRGELFDGTMTRLAWFFAPIVALYVVAAVVLLLFG